MHISLPVAARAPRSRRFATVSAALAAAALAGAAILSAAGASAEPVSVDPAGDAPLPSPPAAGPVLSAPPSTVQSVDGWTLTLSANSETLTPVPPLAPGLATRDFSVSGLFNGSLRNSRGGQYPTPSGVLEVGYQVQCVPTGMLAAMKRAVTNHEVLKQDFQSAEPSAAVTDYRIQVDCMGPALIRSYAILTRSTNTHDAVVGYYGVPNPV